MKYLYQPKIYDILVKAHVLPKEICSIIFIKLYGPYNHPQLDFVYCSNCDYCFKKVNPDVFQTCIDCGNKQCFSVSCGHQRLLKKDFYVFN